MVVPVHYKNAASESIRGGRSVEGGGTGIG